MARASIITAALFLFAAVPAGAAAAEYTLDECISLALERNEKVKAAEADLDYYRGKYHEAQSAFWLPNVSATVMGGGPVAPESKKVDRVTDASNLGSLGVTGAGVIVQGSVDVVWPLYTFGRLGSILDAAGSGIDAATAGIAAARDAVVLDTRKAYYGVIAAREVIAVLEDGKDKLREARKKIKDLLAADDPQATEKDLFKIDFYAAELESRFQETKKGLAVAEAALRVMIGADEDEQVTAKPLDIEAGLPEPGPVSGHLGETAARPDLRALGHAVKARSSLADAAGRLYYPNLFVGGGLRFSQSSVQFDTGNPLVRDDLNYLGGAVGLGLRLELDVGIKLAQEEQARAELSKLRFQSALAARGAALQVRKAHADYVHARANWLAYKDGAKAARKWLAASMLNYNIGVGDTRDLLEALVAQAQGRIQQLKAAYEARVALAELELASGKGTGR
ncbi:MAG: TolC family protein [Deltaproteobacteria bacterium]|nr:TolC family protein [Deltaproteobacteria bacterium]